MPEERTNVLKIFTTPGEFEPFTFILYQVRDLRELHVTITDLTGEKEIIRQADLDLRLVTYWNIRYPYRITEGIYRNVPELFEKVTVNDVKRKECQRYWIIAHIPADTSAGIYKAEIRIEHVGLKNPIFLLVECKVLDFKLKKDPHKHFSAYFSDPERKYRGMTERLYETAVNNEL